MKISFSDHIVEFQGSKIISTDLKNQNKGILKNDETLKKVSKINMSKINYNSEVIDPELSTVIASKKFFDSSKPKNPHLKQNIAPSEKFHRSPLKLNPKTFPNEIKIEKTNPSKKKLSANANKSHSKQKIAPNKQESKVSNFLDKHISTSKVSPKQATPQKQKRFDITKLDFSFNQTSVQQQAKSQKICKDKEYASLVSKSRSNIKKIIELNRFLKESQSQKKVANCIEKTEQNKFIEDIQILDKIKVGCFGTVFKAKIKSTGKLVAIKSIPYDRKHHQREEEICRMVDNPFIVKIYKVYYTSDLQVEKKEPIKVKIAQQRIRTIKSFKNDLSASKSVKRLLRSPTKNNIQISNESDDQQIDLNEELKKNLLSKSRLSKLDEHCNEYHRIINIAMELYDCDLNDYIMMKMKVDNLTLKLFCYQMLRSVLYIHSYQICHRDIKPNNFLIKKHLLVLTDFGSAKIMKNHKNSNVAYICSRYYRAPELILGYGYYDKPVDIWSLGCVMAELCLGKPIFKGSNTLDQLVKIIRIIGQPNWRQISFMMEKLPKLPQIESKGLKNIFPPHVSTMFIDLLESMLVINPLERITAGQALCHPFFDEIRDQINFQQICKEMDISHFLKFNRDELKQNQHLKNKLIPIWACHQQKHEGLRTNNYLHS